MQLGLLAMSVTLAPALAVACEIATYEKGYKVPPATVGADCSFTVPGKVTYYTETAGNAAVDIGGGKVGQRVSTGFGCGYDEEIWIVDCNSGEMLGIRGRQSEDMDYSRRADLLYPPAGALRLSAKATVADLTAVAAREGYDYFTDFAERLRPIARRNRPDPTCGCRLFYPDSANN